EVDEDLAEPVPRAPWTKRAPRKSNPSWHGVIRGSTPLLYTMQSSPAELVSQSCSEQPRRRNPVRIARRENASPSTRRAHNARIRPPAPVTENLVEQARRRLG